MPKKKRVARRTRIKRGRIRRRKKLGTRYRKEADKKSFKTQQPARFAKEVKAQIDAFKDVLRDEFGASHTPKNIKKAYYMLARKYHPDKNIGEEEKAAQNFQALGNAYDMFKNPKKLNELDEFNKINNNLPTTQKNWSELMSRTDILYYDIQKLTARCKALERKKTNNRTGRLARDCDRIKGKKQILDRLKLKLTQLNNDIKKWLNNDRPRNPAWLKMQDDLLEKYKEELKKIENFVKEMYLLVEATYIIRPAIRRSLTRKKKMRSHKKTHPPQRIRRPYFIRPNLRVNPKKATKKASKKAPKKASKKATKKASKKAPKKASKKAPKKASKKAPKKASKKAPKKASKKARSSSPSNANTRRRTRCAGPRPDKNVFGILFPKIYNYDEAVWWRVQVKSQWMGERTEPIRKLVILHNLIKFLNFMIANKWKFGTGISYNKHSILDPRTWTAASVKEELEKVRRAENRAPSLTVRGIPVDVWGTAGIYFTNENVKKKIIADLMVFANSQNVVDKFFGDREFGHALNMRGEDFLNWLSDKTVILLDPETYARRRRTCWDALTGRRRRVIF